jgi:hypothetical protein
MASTICRGQDLPRAYPWGWAVRLLATVFALVLFAVPAAQAEMRVALVIGIAAYRNAVTLQNPRNDATDCRRSIEVPWLDTIVGLDLDKSGMEEKEIAFARAAHDGDIALAYYSGHAMQFGAGI